jgi:tetratricopeptide (TPR) repeat protein
MKTLCKKIIWFFIILLSAQNTEAKIPDFALNQKKAVVAVYITDKNGSEVASGKGFVVDSDGIIATNCRLISKWLEDVEYSIIVETENSALYPIDKLIAYSRRQDIALFKINAKGLTAVKLPSDYNSSKYIQRHIAIYKKSSPDLSKISSPLPIAKQTEKSALISFAPLKPHGPAKLPEKIKIESAEEHFIFGLKYEGENKYADAAEAYKRAIKLKPDYFDAHMSLGLVYYRLGKYSDAIDAYKQALNIKPDFMLYNKLGAIYIITGKYSMAIDAFEQAAVINSKNPETYFNLGISYFLNGDKDTAYEKYIILNKLDKERAENLFEFLYR